MLKLAKIGMLGNLNDPKAPPQRREMEDATRALELKVIAREIRTPDDIHGAIEVLANARVDLVIVLQTAMILSERRRVAELMAAKRLAAIYGYRDHVDDGGLINVNWIFRRSAIYVHKILSGDAPSDLPVEFLHAVGDGRQPQPPRQSGSRFPSRFS